ncbi:alpha/beta hydrolase [bacterium]|nr:alpha/beta hydrolase [bacterium]
MKYIEKTIVSKDNTKIAYYIANPEAEKTVVIVNGLGGSFNIWEKLINSFPNYRWISWDYRGLYKSDIPVNRTDVTLVNHLQDLETIWESEKLDKAIFLSWSLGGQVLLNTYKNHPEWFEAILFISSSYKHFFKEMTHFIPKLYKFEKNIFSTIEKFHKYYSFLLKKVTKIPSIIFYMKKLRWINDAIDDSYFKKIVDEYVNLDMGIYFNIVKEMNDTSFDDLLEKIDIPVFISAGTSDYFIPFEHSKKMKDKIKNSMFLEVYHGTHYHFIEFPEMISLAIKKFFRENSL